MIYPPKKEKSSKSTTPVAAKNCVWKCRNLSQSGFSKKNGALLFPTLQQSLAAPPDVSCAGTADARPWQVGEVGTVTTILGKARWWDGHGSETYGSSSGGGFSYLKNRFISRTGKNIIVKFLLSKL